VAQVIGQEAFDCSSNNGTFGADIPATCTAMVVFYSGYDGGGTSSLDSMTVDTAGFVRGTTGTGGGSDYYGYAYLLSPTTGAEDLTWTASFFAQEGCGMIVYLNEVDLDNFLRDNDVDFRSSQGTLTTTVLSDTDDLVISQLVAYIADPVTTATGQTEFMSNDTTGLNMRQDGFEVDEPGATDTSPTGTSNYGSLVSLAIRNEAAAGVPFLPFFSKRDNVLLRM